MAYKQVIIIRQDLKLPKGKLASQVAHASVESVLRSNKETVEEWRKEGMKKIIVKVNDLNELLEYQTKAKKDKLVASLIKDAGKTTVEPGTITCLGVGPDKEEKIDKLTKDLKLL
jgi:PTH2 family peptidyl-tRNA hydrolase